MYFNSLNWLLDCSNGSMAEHVLSMCEALFSTPVPHEPYGGTHLSSQHRGDWGRRIVTLSLNQVLWWVPEHTVNALSHSSLNCLSDSVSGGCGPLKLPNLIFQREDLRVPELAAPVPQVETAHDSENWVALWVFKPPCPMSSLGSKKGGGGGTIRKISMVEICEAIF